LYPVFNGVIPVLAAVTLLGVSALAVSLKAAAESITGRARARAQAAALLAGDPMPGEKKRRRRSRRRHGAGLPFKLALFMMALALFVTGMVSAPLYAWVSRTRREILFQGLWDRAQVLLEGLAGGSRVWLPRGELRELARLPERSAAIPEARSITITAVADGFHASRETVWATSDPDILSKIDTPQLIPGVSRLTDALIPRTGTIIREWEKYYTLPGVPLPEGGRGGVEPPYSSGLPESTGRLIPDLLNFIFTRRGAADGENRSYLFYRPVVTRDEPEGRLLGFVRLEVNTGLILEEISRRQRNFIALILTVAGAAIAIGIVGAVLLSSLIILPIRRLVSHVELIRDTENMAAFDGMDIRIKSRDELSLLGRTINDMTRGLVKAAQASQDLTIGKELQKRFIPLETDREGNKLTTGFKQTPHARFFGYYEGAKGVSGDYFDYQDLDGRYYAIIKCDVAGKGVPAALIMIQVATMFLNYFNDWTADDEGMRIEKAVYQINEFIEALGFSGRFAAFALCLFDSETGLLRFCNAGDNIVHWYDASERKMRHVTLRETPAAGVLPNFLVDSRGGYTVQTLLLDHGDMLFLYTDGIEESKRKFRDEKFNEILCAESITGLRGSHGNHRPGQAVEEMGRDRVEGIINAVMNKEQYYLRKYHNPEGEGALHFDFSSCAEEVDEVILALVSAEKMFRVFRRPGAHRGGDEASKVLVDRTVDTFLRKHFRHYQTYCSRTKDYSENPGYMYYTGINEDPQYDDITILGIRRT
jgi:serine phosphatase RsbU (regulator of sigma subunit)